MRHPERECPEGHADLLINEVWYAYIVTIVVPHLEGVANLSSRLEAADKHVKHWT